MYCDKNCAIGDYIGQGRFRYLMYCEKISVFLGYINRKHFKNPLDASIDLAIFPNPLGSTNASQPVHDI